MFHYNSDCAHLSSQQIVDWIWQDEKSKKAFMQVFNLAPADNTQEISMQYLDNEQKENTSLEQSM